MCFSVCTRCRETFNTSRADQHVCIDVDDTVEDEVIGHA